ncbi:MAG: M1 family metallopeptidase [Planctomycetes bacterium]|nr:M1 family metallopeptidase [Planctomycetota bacterium]MCW8134669.1 M1 family metallopeptidase [Planctomycetota bacterium]
MNFSLTEQDRFFAQAAVGNLEDKPSWKPFMKKGVTPKWSRDRVVDVRHIKLEIKPDFKQRSISGTCTLTVSPINDGATFLDLDACEMEISSVKVNGDKADFRHDGETLTVHFGRELKADQPIDIAVSYTAKPRRGAYFVGPDEHYPDKHLEFWTQGQDEDSRYWFPCFDYPNEKATSEILVEVPKGMASLSNGKLVSTEPRGDHELHHWKHDVPHVAYLVTLVVGNYVKVSKEWDGIPVDYYVPPGREADGERAFGRTPEMVKFYSEKTGVRYPYAKYAQITAEDFIFGGMENTTATTQTALTLHDERAHLDFSSEPLVSHELAHQWFGDYLTCRDWSHAWLNESFATYFEAMWWEHSRGDDEFKYYLDGDWKVYLAEDKGSYRRAIQTNVYNEPLDLFDRHLYQKGAVILHHLRKLLGDRLWWKAINRYLTSNAADTVITQDLATALEEVTGRNWDWWFAQWIYGGGHPQFKLKAKWDDKTGTLDFSILQTQKQDELTAIFRTPARVRFVGKGLDETREFEIDKPAHRYHLALAKRPEWIAFDPGNSIPKTVELDFSEDMLIAQLQHDDDIMGRVHAARALAGKATLKSEQALEKALHDDKFWGVQAECAAALGKLHTSGALDALCRASKLKHPKARRAVAGALGEWRGSDKAADKLAQMLNKDESYYVAAEAALALGKGRTTGAYDHLLPALARDSHVDVIRSHVFSAFCELRDMRALTVLHEWAAPGKPQQARYAAVSALGRLAKESTEEKDKRAAREALEPMLEGEFRLVMSAISGLGALKDAAAIPALAKLARATHDSRLKKRALDTIEAIRAAQGTPKELKELRDDYDKLKDEYEKLEERLDKLEQLRANGKHTGNGKTRSQKKPGANGKPKAKPQKARARR